MEGMYYLLNRKWFDLPQIALSIEPNWSCQLEDLNMGQDPSQQLPLRFT
ncbi:MAG: hypothetical protein FWC84_05915 [Alphaproteobacteria bacterium]|nr:hypothetical protein [Alphaproteobacteria bacterium]